MPPIIIPTTLAPVTMRVPIAGWVIIGTGLYLFLATLIICIRQCLVRSGACSDCCGCCGKSDQQTNIYACCLECSQMCDCAAPNLKSCCDSLCGPRKTCDIDDCISCNCFGGGGGCCEASATPVCQLPTCPDCPTVDYESPNCECNEIVCCCVRISIMSQAPS